MADGTTGSESPGSGSTGTESTGSRGDLGLATLAGRGAIAAVLAVGVNVVLVAVVPGAIGHPPYGPLTIPPVALFTAVGVLLATVVYALVRRLADRPDRTFAVVAAVALLVSFVPDLTFARDLPGATTNGVVLLMVMHVVAAVVAVAVLTRGVGEYV